MRSLNDLANKPGMQQLIKDYETDQNGLRDVTAQNGIPCVSDWQLVWSHSLLDTEVGCNPKSSSSIPLFSWLNLYKPSITKWAQVGDSSPMHELRSGFPAIDETQRSPGVGTGRAAEKPTESFASLWTEDGYPPVNVYITMEYIGIWDLAMVSTP